MSLLQGFCLRTMRDRTVVKGLCLMTMAMMVLPFMDALSKYLAADYPAEEIVFFRNLMHALILLPIVFVKYGRQIFVPKPAGLHVARSVCFITASAFHVVALGRMPLADAIALIFTFPFIVTAVSPLFFGERIRIYRWMAVVAGFVGVLFVIKPGFATLNSGVPFSILAAILTAAYVLMTHKLSGSAPTLVMLFYPACLGSLIFLPIVMLRWVTPDPIALGLMLIIGAISALVHGFIILAYEQSEPSLLMPLVYLQIIVSTALGLYFFGDLPDRLTFIGITIIIASGVFIAWREGKSLSKR